MLEITDDGSKDWMEMNSRDGDFIGSRKWENQQDGQDEAPSFTRSWPRRVRLEEVHGKKQIVLVV
jgi:hypothetical protein